MYISLTDRPGGQSGAPPVPATRRRPVARVVVILGVVSLLTDVSSESVSAILPIYLTTVVGLSTVSYGFVDALYQGVSALVRIGGGWAADRGGRPKWVAFVGYAVSAVSRGFLLIATGVASISTVIAADRIGKGLRTAPRDSMISAATAPEHQATAFGVHRTLDTVGAAIGPLIAAAILWWIPDGYLTVMVVSLAFAVVGVAVLGLFVPDRPAEHPTPAPRPAFRWRSLAEPALIRLLVVAGVLGVLTVGDGFLYLALLDRGGFDARWFPLLYVGTNLAYLSLAVPLGRLADRVGKARVLVAGHVLLLGAYLCASAPAAGAALLLATLLLLGAYYAATDGVIAALAGGLVDPAARASGIASAQTVVAVARMASSGGFGVLWFAVGPGAALMTVGAALLVAIPIAFRTVARLDSRASA